MIIITIMKIKKEKKKKPLPNTYTTYPTSNPHRNIILNTPASPAHTPDTNMPQRNGQPSQTKEHHTMKSHDTIPLRIVKLTSNGSLDMIMISIIAPWIPSTKPSVDIKKT